MKPIVLAVVVLGLTLLPVLAAAGEKEPPEPTDAPKNPTVRVDARVGSFETRKSNAEELKRLLAGEPTPRRFHAQPESGPAPVLDASYLP